MPVLAPGGLASRGSAFSLGADHILPGWPGLAIQSACFSCRLQEQNASFVSISEYADKSEVTRARSWFFLGRRNILVYTERAHFYNRFKIRGIKARRGTWLEERPGCDRFNSLGVLPRCLAGLLRFYPGAHTES